jgi:hypothetical protein
MPLASTGELRHPGVPSLQLSTVLSCQEACHVQDMKPTSSRFSRHPRRPGSVELAGWWHRPRPRGDDVFNARVVDADGRTPPRLGLRTVTFP